MTKNVSPLDQAAATRDMARRARRLALTLSMGGDRARLQQYAEELDERATLLEADADKLK